MPEKKADPGRFAINIGIGNHRFKGLCDLGASVSLMPLSVWSKVNVGPLEPVEMKLFMANNAWINPTCTIDDVPVRLGKFFIPTDFIVVDMEEDSACPIILGRPFLATADANICVR